MPFEKWVISGKDRRLSRWGLNLLARGMRNWMIGTSMRSLCNFFFFFWFFGKSLSRNTSTANPTTSFHLHRAPRSKPALFSFFEPVVDGTEISLSLFFSSA